MEITDNRIKKVQSIKTVTTALLLLVGLASIFPLTAMAAAPTFDGVIVKVLLSSNVSTATLDVSYHFSDTDGDILSYTAVSSDTSKVTVSVSGSYVTFTQQAQGEATVAVTASDPGGLTATQRIAVEVYSDANFPFKSDLATMGAFILPAEGEPIYVDQLNKFDDNLNVEIDFTTTGVIGGDWEKGVVKVEPLKEGSSSISLDTRPGGGSVLEWISAQVTQSNRAPAAQGMISPVTVYVGGTATDVDISSKFNDPDGNPLIYTAVSSDATKATVSLSGVTVKITPVAVGTATVTVTASDGKLTGTQTIAVTVPNRAPTKVGTIDPVTVNLGAGATDVDVSSKFVDSDGHTLTYTALSSDTSKATVSVSGSTVKITGVAVGTATVTVTVNDSNGGTATANHRCYGAQPRANEGGDH